MTQIHLLGTSHISRDSIAQVKKLVQEFNPDIIAIELDAARLPGLLSKERPKPRLRDVRSVGVKGFLFQVLGAWAEKKLGDIVGVKPGAEMKTAIELASAHNKQLALIDQPIQITLNRLTKSISWKEKRTFFSEIIRSLFSRKKKLPFDLRKVPESELIVNMLNEVKTKYPNVYRVLLTERNHYMAKRLIHLAQHNPEKKILAIVGAGHLEGIKKIMQPHNPPL